jgi:2',3'-cyclic-nucleotide 2'-phosphodiesterase (5'-nucleotidase family)
MKTSLRLSSIFTSLAFLLALVVVPGTAKAAVTFTIPTAPLNVIAVPAEGGFTVSWEDPASNGNAELTQFVIDGGQGTCTTAVPATQHSAFVPAVNSSAAAFKVYAVNSQGFGPGSLASESVTPEAARAGFFAVDSKGFTKNVGSTTGNFPRLRIKSSAYFGSVSTPSGNGAWLLAHGGRIVTLGDAVVTSQSLSEPAIQLVSSYNRLGYYVIGKRGEVSASANAPVITGSLSNTRIIVGGVPTSSGKGLWLLTSTGKIIGLGDATSDSLPKNHYVRVIARATGDGFWAITKAGAVVSYGDAPQISAVITNIKDTALAASGDGFYVLDNSGTITAFGDAAQLETANVANAVALINTAKVSEVKDFQIAAFSDFHGALDYSKTTSAGIDTYTSGAAVLAANFEADRAQNPATFTFSSGDNWGAAPPLSTVFDEMPTVEAFNYMGVDVSTFGNHEHDKPLTNVNARIAASQYKWVVSNYSSLSEINAQNLNGVATAPWTIVDRGGVKVGVIGLNTPETKEVIFPGNLGQIEIGDVLGTSASALATKAQVQSAIKAARKAGADVVVSLVHEGFGQFNAETSVAEGRLLDIAPVLEGSDIVLGGHSHLKYAGIVGNKLIAETPNAGTLYNRIHACVDTATHRTLGARVEHVVPTVKVPAGTAIASTPLNQNAVNSIAGYKANLGAKYNVVIGSIADVAPNGGTPAIQRTYETALGNYIADNLRTAMGTQIAIINGGGIRDMLPAKTFVPTDASIVRPSWSSLQPGYTTSNGPWQVTSSGPYTLTVGDVATVLPFGNTAATTTITGADVWAALENGVSQVATGGGRFPQVSGLKFTFDMSIAANSGRVTSVTLTDGTPVPNTTETSYTLATNDFMVAGGDGYTMFGGLAKARTRDVLETLVREAIIRDSANGPVVMSTDGRITRIG